MKRFIPEPYRYQESRCRKQRWSLGDKAFVSFVLSVLLLLFLSAMTSGCSLFHANDYTRTFDIKNPDIVTVHEVSVTSASVLTKKGLEGLSLAYGNVRIGVNKYSQAGDVEMINALGTAISNGIMAYFTYGTSTAVKGAVIGTLMASQPSASTNAPAIK